MAFTEWHIDRVAKEITGPCGCRLPNTIEGVRAAQHHRCPAPAPTHDRAVERTEENAR